MLKTSRQVAYRNSCLWVTRVILKNSSPATDIGDRTYDSAVISRKLEMHHGVALARYICLKGRLHRRAMEDLFAFMASISAGGSGFERAADARAHRPCGLHRRGRTRQRDFCLQTGSPPGDQAYSVSRRSHRTCILMIVVKVVALVESLGSIVSLFSFLEKSSFRVPTLPVLES